MEKRTRSRRTDHDFIPEFIASKFQAELTDLVSVIRPGTFAGDYLRSQFLSKYCDPTTTPAIERRRAAIQKWRTAEARNMATNLRLYENWVSDDPEDIGLDLGWTTYGRLVRKIREYIVACIGQEPPVDLYKGGYHTNGASTRIRRSEVAAFQKYSGKAHGTEKAIMKYALNTSNVSVGTTDFAIQDSSVLFTVPKKSDIDRVACKEPEINMYLQRQVGKFIRRRLRKRAGIDLLDQTVNQEYARIAHKTGLATIDLSSASDLISNGLVMQLLPFRWYRELDEIRVHSTVIDSEVHELEMFSSMGNGFTFELESLLFLCIVRAILCLSGIKGTVKVYGDDIVAPSRAVPRIMRVFSWFGFKVNTEKTFWKGGFRESCGKHYSWGVDVSPFYLREKVQRKSDIIRLLNQLYDWSRDRKLEFMWDEEAAIFHRKWSKHIPLDLRGGRRFDSITSLVTADPPRKRLHWLRRKTKIDEDMELGRYAHWHFMKNAIDVDDLELNATREGRAILISADHNTGRNPWMPYLLIGGDTECG